MHFHVFSLTGMIPSLESKVSNVKSFLNFWSRISSLECLEFLWIWMYLIFEYRHSLITHVQDNWYEAECSHIVSTLEPLGNDNAYIFGISGWTSCKDEGAMDVLLTRWWKKPRFHEIAKLTWNLVGVGFMGNISIDNAKVVPSANKSNN